MTPLQMDLLPPSLGAVRQIPRIQLLSNLSGCFGITCFFSFLYQHDFVYNTKSKVLLNRSYIMGVRQIRGENKLAWVPTHVN